MLFAGKNNDTRIKYLKLWRLFLDAYQALLDIDDNADLAPQAKSAANKSSLFGVFFSETFPASAASYLYFHILVYHIEAMILKFGNLSKWSMQVRALDRNASQFGHAH